MVGPPGLFHVTASNDGQHKKERYDGNSNADESTHAIPGRALDANISHTVQEVVAGTDRTYEHHVGGEKTKIAQRVSNVECTGTNKVVSETAF